MERSGLIDRVKINLDEFTPDGVALPFDDYIGPILDQCAIDLLKIVPLHTIKPAEIPLDAIAYKDDKAYIEVPADYIRLYEIKYPLWEKSVRKAIKVEDPEYRLQENDYLKGGYGRPCVAIVTISINDGDVTRYFECSKVLSDSLAEDLIPRALYVKKQLPEELDDVLVDALTWHCAASIFEINKLIDESKMALERASAAISNI